MNKFITLAVSAIVAAATLLLAALPSAAQVIVVNNQTKSTVCHNNIDLTQYTKRSLANGTEAYFHKNDKAAVKPKAGYNVTFLLSYDQSAMFPNGYVTIKGDKFSGDVDMNMDWTTGQYKLVYQLPAGTYDFIASGMIMQGGMAFNIKEMVEVNQDMTVTFDFAESNIKYNLKSYKPNGEETKLGTREIVDGQMIIKSGNVNSYNDIFMPYLKGVGVVGGISSWNTLEVDGKNPSETLIINKLSDRYKLLAERMFADDDYSYIIKYETDDMNTTLLENDPTKYVLYEEDFTSIGTDNNNLCQGFYTIEMIDNISTGNGINGEASVPIATPSTKVYVNAPRKTGNETEKFDILVQPVFRDNVYETQYSKWIDYDFYNNPIEMVDTILIYRTVIGVPVLINNDGSKEYVNAGHDAGGNYMFHVPEGGGDIVEYPGHPQFSYTKQDKALNLGSSCPIASVMLQNSTGYYAPGKYSYIAPCFIGRYGEIVGGYFKTDIRYNDELITDSYMNKDEDMYNFAMQNKPDGVITAHFETTNAVVDGLQGKNTTDVYYDQRKQDWTAPTLQMLRFVDTDGKIIDRFETADAGTLEFAGGDFNYNKTKAASWFDCKEQTVEVSYAPYNSGKWETLDVTEVPDNFCMPGFGYFYRAPLQAVADQGWFDLKIKLTDQSGNWQEQTVSPAFRIGNAPSGITGVKTGTATEVARYTVDGRSINTPQAGVNIVKMSDGSVKKVWVK